MSEQKIKKQGEEPVLERQEEPVLGAPKKLGEAGWMRREVLGVLGKFVVAATGVATFGPSIFITGCAKRTPEEKLMAKSIDITELVRTAQAGRPLNLESAVADQLQASPEKAKLLQQARARGWNDDILRDTFIEIRPGNADVRKATAALMGREFGFDRIFLMFDPKESWLVTFPEKAALCLNPIGIPSMAPKQIQESVRDAMPHEIAHIATWRGSNERLGRKLERTPYFNAEETVEAAPLGKMKQIPEEAVWELGFSEVVCDGLGFIMSKHLERGGGFKRSFVLHTTGEISRYRKKLNSGEPIYLGELVDIASMHAFALHMGDTRLGNELDGLAEDSISRMCEITDPSLKGEVETDYRNMLKFLQSVASVAKPRK